MAQALTTDKRKQGFKRLLKLLSTKRRKKQEAVRKLTTSVTVNREAGDVGIVEEKQLEPVYSSSESASDLVKDIVKDDRLPVEREGKYLYRSDLERGEIT